MNETNPKPLLAVFALSLLFGEAILFGDDSGKTDFSAQELRCEYLVNPTGIDVVQPRLSWILSPAAGIRGQSAYRVLVASSAAILQKDQGDLWDSGRVASARSSWIEYAGKKL